MKEEYDIGKPLPPCGCSSLGEMIAGKNVVCEMHSSTTPEGWEKEFDEYFSDGYIKRISAETLKAQSKKVIKDILSNQKQEIEKRVANWTTNYSGEKGTMADELARDILSALELE